MGPQRTGVRTILEMAGKEGIAEPPGIYHMQYNTLDALSIVCFRQQHAGLQMKRCSHLASSGHQRTAALSDAI